MVEQGIIDGAGPARDGAYTEFRNPAPGDCDHCGRPLMETGWYRIESYDRDDPTRRPRNHLRQLLTRLVTGPHTKFD